MPTTIDQSSVVSLLAPISPTEPSGVELDDDFEYSEFQGAFDGALAEWRLSLQRQNTGNAGESSGDSGRELKLWQNLSPKASQLLNKSKDLWIAYFWTAAETRLRSLEGLRDGLKLIKGLLEDFWDSVHPQQQRTESVPRRRIAPLEQLATTPFIVMVRESILVRGSNGNIIRVKDVLASLGAWDPPEGTSRPDAAALQTQIMGSLNDAARTQLQTTIAQIAEYLEALPEIFEQKTGGEASLKLDELGRMMTALNQFTADSLNAERLPPPISQGSSPPGTLTPSPIAPGAQQARPAAPGEINSREEAAATLDKVSRFFEKYEPTSPLPMLLRRAKLLIGKNFLETLQDLTPDAVETFSRIAGISNSTENEETNDENSDQEES